jgi:hypothetical protein
MMVTLPQNEPPDSCFLHIEYEGSTYIGCLLVEDHAFCRHVTEVLQVCRGRPIADIGGLDLTYTS